MAKKSKIAKNRQRKSVVGRYIEKRKELTSLIKNPEVSLEEKRVAQRKLEKLPRDSSITRVRNRCEISGRPRGYMGMFSLSRMVFRQYALEGLLPGVKKTSW